MILSNLNVFLHLQCDLYEPCDPRVHCTNIVPGFICDACPSGYSGPHARGVRVEHFDHTFKRQRCIDIDECQEGIAQCAPNTICMNLEGTYECQCAHGFARNGTHECYALPGMCPDGTMCDKNAHCRRQDYNTYTCKCKVGWAGDGFVCGSDKDLDGWPDYDLRCSSIRCKKDNCVTVPNSGQEDSDGNGIGDACDPNYRRPTPPDSNDWDFDNILNQFDNCPRKANTNQADEDGDGIGDVCDNCPNVPNPSQSDGM